MKKYFITGLATTAWLVIGLVSMTVLLACCTKKVDEQVSDDGMLLDDNLVALRSSDGKISIKNTVTGEITIKDIKIDWTSPSPKDSLAVYCSEGKRGYYNIYTGKIAVPAQYRRAWVFSEGLAAVQKNGMIGFIDHEGNVVIPFSFPYHGNPLSSFVFNEEGRCVVANNDGKCGVIDKTGKWLIEPEYDNVSSYKEYAIVSKAGERMQVGYDGRVINSFVLDNICRLTYEKCSVHKNDDGEPVNFNESIDTGFFSYRIGGRCGLMNANCERLTEPIYYEINAVDKNMFRATLLDYYSEVILNAKGEVMK